MIGKVFGNMRCVSEETNRLHSSTHSSVGNENEAQPSFCGGSQWIYSTMLKLPLKVPFPV